MELISQPIEQYAGTLRDPQVKAYRVSDTDGKQLAHVFKTRESYTFAWYGSVDFSTTDFITDNIFLRAIFAEPGSPYDYLDYLPPAPWALRFRFKLSVISYKNEAGPGPPDSFWDSPELSPELVQFEKLQTSPPNYRPWKLSLSGIRPLGLPKDRPVPDGNVFEHPDRMSFVRIDSTISLELWEANVSFTAENPKTREPGKAELALKTALSYRYSYRLLRRIAANILQVEGQQEDSGSETVDELVQALSVTLTTLIHQDIE